LYAQDGDVSDLETFLATNCVCDVEDCLEWLNDAGSHHCRAILLFRRGRSAEAFDVWRKLSLNEITDPNFPGVADCIGRLVKCTEKDIFNVVPWMVALDGEATVDVSALI
jgi:hypothetical protein